MFIAEIEEIGGDGVSQLLYLGPVGLGTSGAVVLTPALLMSLIQSLVSSNN